MPKKTSRKKGRKKNNLIRLFPLQPPPKPFEFKTPQSPENDELDIDFDELIKNPPDVEAFYASDTKFTHEEYYRVIMYQRIMESLKK
jgi:hypothetical protein